MATPAPENDRPSYLSSPGFVSLTNELHKLGFGMGYTPTHLLVDTMRFSHELCDQEPNYVITMIMARLENSLPVIAKRPTQWRWSLGLLSSEFTSGGQHVTERSG